MGRGEDMTLKTPSNKVTARRRQQALDTLQKLADEIRGRNRNLTGNEADELADRFVREVIEDMIAEGKIGYDSGTT